MGRFSALNSSRFRRYPDDGYIGGVCAGVADMLGWNVRLIRALAVLTMIFGGGFPIVLVYCLLWYVMENTRGIPPLGGERDFVRSGPDCPGGAPPPRYSDIPRSVYASGADLKMRFSRLEQRLSSMEECVTSNDYELRRELRKLES